MESVRDRDSNAPLRQWLGDSPRARLNARLKASSESYPTRRAIAATPRSVVASNPSARCMRHSVR